MGIDVNLAKVVSLNQAHQHGIVTDPARAVAKWTINHLTIASLFRRRRLLHDDGDGNPFIYALKGKFGYSIRTSDRRSFYKIARQVLPSALAEFEFDSVVPLPSSAAVARLLGIRISRVADRCPVVDCLRKATVEEALGQAPFPAQIRSGLRTTYASQLRRMASIAEDSSIEMKSIPLKVRPFFNPLAATDLV